MSRLQQLQNYTEYSVIRIRNCIDDSLSVRQVQQIFPQKYLAFKWRKIMTIGLQYHNLKGVYVFSYFNIVLFSRWCNVSQTNKTIRVTIHIIRCLYKNLSCHCVIIV